MFWAHRDPYNWPNPEQFAPARHAPSKNTPFHSFLAFMHGQRNCVGKRFAMMSLVVSVALLVKRFKFEVPEGYALEVVAKGVMITPRFPLRLQVSSRPRNLKP